MKKMIAVLAITTTLLAGCSSGPQKGYYDSDGVYHPSASAENSDRWETAGAVAGAAAAVAGVTLGIVALTK